MIQTSEGRTCQRCGVHFDRHESPDKLYWAAEHSPAHSLHLDEGLGGNLTLQDLKGLKKAKMIRSNPRYLTPRKTARERFPEDCVSELWSLLKGFGFDEGTTHAFAKRTRRIAKRYVQKNLGREAVIDVLTLFLLEASATAKDQRLAQMAVWLEGLKGRPMPDLLAIRPVATDR